MSAGTAPLHTAHPPSMLRVAALLVLLTASAAAVGVCPFAPVARHLAEAGDIVPAPAAAAFVKVEEMIMGRGARVFGRLARSALGPDARRRRWIAARRPADATNCARTM